MYDPRAAGVRQWGCSECKGDTFADQDIHRDGRNCDGLQKRLYFEWAVDVEQCPWATLSTEVSLWLNMWQDWERWRVLPCGGSDLMQYPAYFLEAFSLCASTKIQVENEVHERDHSQIEKDKRQQIKQRNQRF